MRKLGFSNVTNKEYVEHIQSVKHEFLRRDHTDVLAGPKALKDEGPTVVWERGLELLYEEYPEIWDIGRFSGPGELRSYA